MVLDKIKEYDMLLSLAEEYENEVKKRIFATRRTYI